MRRMLPVRLVRGRLCSAQLGIYSAGRQQLWLDTPLVNDSGCYWYRMIAPIVSLVRGDAACLIWSRHPKAMHQKSFGIDRYAWRNPMMMWLCVGVVRFLSDKMWILNRIKLWKICENPSRVVALLSMSMTVMKTAGSGAPPQQQQGGRGRCTTTTTIMGATAAVGQWVHNHHHHHSSRDSRGYDHDHPHYGSDSSSRGTTMMQQWRQQQWGQRGRWPPPSPQWQWWQQRATAVMAAETPPATCHQQPPIIPQDTICTTNTPDTTTTTEDHRLENLFLILGRPPPFLLFYSANGSHNFQLNVSLFRSLFCLCSIALLLIILYNYD